MELPGGAEERRFDRDKLRTSNLSATIFRSSCGIPFPSFSPKKQTAKVFTSVARAGLLAILRQGAARNPVVGLQTKVCLFDYL
jgi:hypothetical protein